MKILLTTYFMFLTLGAMAQREAIGFRYDDINKFKANNEGWFAAYNEGFSSGPGKFYHEDAKVLCNGTLSSVSELVKLFSFVKDEFGTVGYFQNIDIFKNDDKRFLELSSFQLEEETVLYALTAWVKEEDKWKIAFQALDISQEGRSIDSEEILTVRKQWEDYSNGHDVEALIGEVYAQDAIYLGGGKVSAGSQAIKKRYKYMKEEKWQIKLERLKEVTISPKKVYEVGGFTSTGKGLYFLIWEYRQSQWRATFDFNF